LDHEDEVTVGVLRSRRGGAARPPGSLALGGATLAGLGVALDAYVVEPRWIAVSRHTVAVEGLPPALEGFSIAHLSDLHVAARYWKPAVTRRAIAMVGELGADLIAVTGDIADSNIGAVVAAEYLRALRPPCGLVAVLGNHDHYGNRRRSGLIVRALREIGARVLINEACAIDTAGGPVWVAGVDDGRTRHADLGRALADVPATARPRILLSHYPDTADALLPGQIDLILAGHTHGGQINLPGVRELACRRNARSHYIGGRYTVQGAPMLISRGIASIGLPVRVLCRPEIILVTLARGSA